MNIYCIFYFTFSPLIQKPKAVQKEHGQQAATLALLPHVDDIRHLPFGDNLLLRLLHLLVQQCDPQWRPDSGVFLLRHTAHLGRGDHSEPKALAGVHVSVVLVHCNPGAVHTRIYGHNSHLQRYQSVSLLCAAFMFVFFEWLIWHLQRLRYGHLLGI